MDGRKSLFQSVIVGLILTIVGGFIAAYFDSSETKMGIFIGEAIVVLGFVLIFKFEYIFSLKCRVLNKKIARSSLIMTWASLVYAVMNVAANLIQSEIIEIISLVPAIVTLIFFWDVAVKLKRNYNGLPFRIGDKMLKLIKLGFIVMFASLLVALTSINPGSSLSQIILSIVGIGFIGICIWSLIITYNLYSDMSYFIVDDQCGLENDQDEQIII